MDPRDQLSVTPTLSELQIIQEMSQVLVLHNSRPTKYLLIFAGGSRIFAGLGDDVYHEKVPKVTSVRQRERAISVVWPHRFVVTAFIGINVLFRWNTVERVL